MKKITLAILISFLIIGSWAVIKAKAQEETETPTPKVSPTTIEDSEVKALKEKIATKVAELRQKNNKAISGTVASLTNNVIKIKTQDDKDYDVKIDDTLTKYYQINGNQKSEVGFSDIGKNDYIIVTGVIDDKKIEANAIYLDILYLVKSGKVTEVDKENYSLSVITTEKDNYTLDIETYTKQQLLNIKTLALEAVGFSKIKEGDTIQFVVKKTATEKENRFSAQKILLIPQEYFMK